jgi:hypothetical protein
VHFVESFGLVAKETAVSKGEFGTDKKREAQKSAHQLRKW